MEVFAHVRKSLPYIGYLDYDPPRPKTTIASLVVALFIILYGAIQSIWFIVYEAQTFDEFGKATTALDICVYAFIVCIIMRTQQSSFLAMFRGMETLFRQRKMIHS